MPGQKMKEWFTAGMETGSLKKQLIVDIIYSGPQLVVKILRLFGSQ